jgi:hypothetical protein
VNPPPLPPPAAPQTPAAHQTPEQLREERRARDALSDQRRLKNRRERIGTALAIGLLVPLALSVLPTMGIEPLMIPVVLLGGAWSVVVQFKRINHLVSCAVYGLAMIALLARFEASPNLFWWLGMVLAGALIGILNDLYRSKLDGL